MTKRKHPLKDPNFWWLQIIFVGAVFGLPFWNDSQQFINDLRTSSKTMILLQLLFVMMVGYALWWIGDELIRKKR